MGQTTREGPVAVSYLTIRIITYITNSARGIREEFKIVPEPGRAGPFGDCESKFPEFTKSEAGTNPGAGAGSRGLHGVRACDASRVRNLLTFVLLSSVPVQLPASRITRPGCTGSGPANVSSCGTRPLLPLRHFQASSPATPARLGFYCSFGDSFSFSFRISFR